VRRLLESALETFRPDADPEAASARQYAEFAAERERAEAALRWPARALFVRRLERVRALIWWREEMRELSSWTSALLRRWSLEAARRLFAQSALAAEGDVWNLDAGELCAALEGSLPPGEVLERAAMHGRISRSFRSFAAPREIGARYPYGGGPPRRAEPARLAHSRGALRGTPSSPGVASGLARVARRLDEAYGVRPGEILVAAFADPGWTPLFGRIAAIVTETGGLLSHTAVIAREYGIPAVLAVPSVAERVKTGDRLRVDGGAGTVELAP
jgi:phosphohistidine swiveling domain-containing protein